MGVVNWWMKLSAIDAPSIDVMGYQIYWYGLILAGGILSAIYFIERSLGPENDSFWFINLVAGLIGARGYHVLSSWGYYSSHLVEVLSFRSGGLGVFGAAAGVAVASYFYAKLHHRSFRVIADKLAVGAALAQGIGRWGNFVNKEGFGMPTDLPWGIFVPLTKRPISSLSSMYFHPLFLYESVLVLLLFLLLFRCSKRSRRESGLLAAIYMIGYGIIRFVLEPMRATTWVVGMINVAEAASIGLVVAGMSLLHSSLRRRYS